MLLCYISYVLKTEVGRVGVGCPLNGVKFLIHFFFGELTNFGKLTIFGELTNFCELTFRAFFPSFRSFTDIFKSTYAFLRLPMHFLIYCSEKAPKKTRSPFFVAFLSFR